jgi:hypothetical protein
VKAKRRQCLTAAATFAAGLLWLGSGAGNAAQRTRTPVMPEPPTKRVQEPPSPQPTGTDQASTEPNLAGSWSITFYLEDEHTEGATQCVVFTTTKTAPSGEEMEGTWTSPSFSGWQGTWQHDGDYVQWYGFTDAAALATSEFGHLPSNSIISGEFNHFIPPDGTTSSAGGWVAKRVADCGAQPMSANLTAPGSSNSDPAVKSSQ